MYKTHTNARASARAHARTHTFDVLFFRMFSLDFDGLPRISFYIALLPRLCPIKMNQALACSVAH